MNLEQTEHSHDNSSDRMVAYRVDVPAPIPHQQRHIAMIRRNIGSGPGIASANKHITSSKGTHLCSVQNRMTGQKIGFAHGPDLIPDECICVPNLGKGEASGAAAVKAKNHIKQQLVKLRIGVDLTG